MKFAFDIQNIAENDGVAISLIGMSIVFLGLILVSLYIFCLPKILSVYDSLRQPEGDNRKAPESGEAVEDSKEAEIMAVIACILNRELTPEDGSTRQRITIRRASTESIWRQAGQMRSLSASMPTRKGF